MMNADELERLADEAKPGEWGAQEAAADGKTWFQVCTPAHREGRRWNDPVLSSSPPVADHLTEANALLIALAPRLAREHAALLRWTDEAAEAIRYYMRFSDRDCGDPECFYCERERQERALLTAFDEIRGES